MDTFHPWREGFWVWIYVYFQCFWGSPAWRRVTLQQGAAEPSLATHETVCTLPGEGVGLYSNLAQGNLWACLGKEDLLWVWKGRSFLDKADCSWWCRVFQKENLITQEAVGNESCRGGQRQIANIQEPWISKMLFLAVVSDLLWTLLRALFISRGFCHPSVENVMLASIMRSSVNFSCVCVLIYLSPSLLWAYFPLLCSV